MSAEEEREDLCEATSQKKPVAPGEPEGRQAEQVRPDDESEPKDRFLKRAASGSPARGLELLAELDSLGL
jgi:hypothetical protein